MLQAINGKRHENDHNLGKLYLRLHPFSLVDLYLHALTVGLVEKDVESLVAFVMSRAGVQRRAIALTSDEQGMIFTIVSEHAD